jgi:nicotinamidase-related amidase
MDQNLKTKNTSLLIMDVQGATVKMLPETGSLFHPLIKAIEFARGQGIPVLYIIVGFRKGYPEVSPENRSFSALKSGAMSLDLEGATEIPNSIAPREDEIIITKKRVSAFTGSDLEVVLRSLGIKHLVLTGIATSGVVLSTLREAADKDYSITVLSDGCADRDEEVHRILLTKIFPRQALVVDTDSWISSQKA